MRVGPIGRKQFYLSPDNSKLRLTWPVLAGVAADVGTETVADAVRVCTSQSTFCQELVHQAYVPTGRRHTSPGSPVAATSQARPVDGDHVAVGLAQQVCQNITNLVLVSNCGFF